MTKIKPFLLLLIVAFAIVSCTSQKLKDGEYTIEIFATNDTHGRLFDSLYIERDSQLVHPYSLASVATFIKEARKKSGDKNVVLLDIGDHLQGDNSVFYYNFIDTINEHIYPKVANYLQYDAVVVGNHDIEPGPAVYDRVRNQLKMPYLAANALNTKSGNPYFEPYTILNKNGLKIAIIGLTNPNIPNWLSPTLWPNIEFEEVTPSLEKWINHVRQKENPHFVIAAIHAGLGDENTNSKENPGRYVASHIKGVDLVFAAHDHKLTAEKFTNDGKEVWLLEGGSRAASLSHATVKFSIANGRVVDVNVDGQNISMNNIAADVDYTDLFNADFLKIKKFTAQPVGYLNDDIIGRDAFKGPSAYVDMIHKLQLEVSGADVSFVAPLSFDTKVNKGELNYQNLLDIYPFENQLNVITMSGAEIKDYLEFSYDNWLNADPLKNKYLFNIAVEESGTKAHFNHPSYNFDSAAGIIYEVDVTQPIGNRVRIISLANGNAFQSNNTYKVAMTSYRANGGGDLLVKGAGITQNELQDRIVERMADIRELLYDKIQEDGFLDAKALNTWQFVPQSIVKELIEKDYQLLFN